MYRQHATVRALSFFWTALSILFISLNLVPTLARAAKITKVRGEQVLIDLQGEGPNYPEGSRYIVMVDGKRKAVIEISKVKGEKAIGKVLKGTAAENGTLSPLSAGNKSSSASPQESASTPTSNEPSSESPTRTEPRARSKRSRKSRRGGVFSSLTFGGVLGYGITGQTVQEVGAPSPTSMSGSGLSLKAFGDMPISDSFGLIGRAGFENFSVKGTSPILGDVKTNILYLDADLFLRYYFLEGKFHVFPLAGMGLYYPISKESGNLDLARLSATTIFFVGGGANYALSDTMYAQASLEYAIFPPSSGGITTSLIDIRVGVGFAL